MDAYSRMYWWLINARNAKGFKTDPWKEKATTLVLRYGYHSRTARERTTLGYRKWVTRQLIQKDSKLALGIFLMLIDPDTFEPPIGKDFSTWNTPQTEYEFDHAGAFTELESDVYHYSGAETKFGYSMWRSGRSQLEQRVRLIDGVMNLGFSKRTVYSLRILVPIIPTVGERGHGRSLTVMRRENATKVDKSIQTDHGDGASVEDDNTDVEHVTADTATRAENEDSDLEGEMIEIPTLTRVVVPYFLKVQSFQD